MNSIGCDTPRYILSFDHRGSFQTQVFGWIGAFDRSNSGHEARYLPWVQSRARLRSFESTAAYEGEPRPKLLARAIDETAEEEVG